MNGIVSAIVIITIIGIIASVMLVLAAKFMYVPEDARIGLVQEVLPGANCGACGYAGCSDYAKAIVESGAPVNLCVPGGAGAATAVGKVMGVKAEVSEPKKAVEAKDLNAIERYNSEREAAWHAASEDMAKAAQGGAQGPQGGGFNPGGFNPGDAGFGGQQGGPQGGPGPDYGNQPDEQ